MRHIALLFVHLLNVCWRRRVLDMSSGIEDFGRPVPGLTLSLFIAWLLVYFCICRGVKWTGKVIAGHRLIMLFMWFLIYAFVLALKYVLSSCFKILSFLLSPLSHMIVLISKRNVNMKTLWNCFILKRVHTYWYNDTIARYLECNYKIRFFGVFYKLALFQIVYFTAIAPYVLLTVILIRGVTLEGALNGLTFYLRPDFSRLQDAQVWVDGGTQVIYSIGVGQGFMITLGSYNSYKSKIVR